MTKAQLQTERDTADRALWAYRHALQYSVAGTPDHVERFKEPDGPARYRVAAYGLTAAHGGVVVVTFEHPNQTPSVNAQYFDDFVAAYSTSYSPSTTPFRIAAERIGVARHKANEVTK